MRKQNIQLNSSLIFSKSHFWPWIGGLDNQVDCWELLFGASRIQEPEILTPERKEKQKNRENMEINKQEMGRTFKICKFENSKISLACKALGGKVVEGCKMA